MGVNISGKGVLSGLATLVAGVVQSFNLLVTKIIGYTNIPGTGGSSYYTTTVGSTGPGFVLINGDGQTAHSANGANWSLGTKLSGQYFTQYSGVYGNGKFVAINGNGQTAYSTDGINWLLGTSIDQAEWNEAPAFGNGIFVASAFTAETTAYSVDGINWIKTFTSGVSFSHTPVFGNGIFVGINRDTGQTYYTTDAITWSSGDVLELNYSAGINLSFANGKFVLISGNGQIAYSTNGQTWSLGTDLDAPFYEPPAFGNDKFTLINEYGQTAYSTDGINWSLGTDLDIGYVSGKIVFGNNKFVLMTSVGITAYSTDGINWSLGTDLPGGFWQPDLLVFGNNLFIGISSNGSNAYSTDGINWSLGNNLPGFQWQRPAIFGTISTLVEVQISIGNQGEEGAEVPAPVDVYTVPPIKTTSIDQVTVKNNSANTITYDLGVLDAGVSLTDQNALINDQAVSSGATATITSISTPLTAGQRIVVFPSTVDVVEIKVYGTEETLIGSKILADRSLNYEGSPVSGGGYEDGLQAWTIAVDSTYDITRDTIIYAGTEYTVIDNADSRVFNPAGTLSFLGIETDAYTIRILGPVQEPYSYVPSPFIVNTYIPF
jgi:hypothetical protein